MPILYEEKNITDHVHLIDLMQCDQQYLATAFLISDGKISYLLDVGTSDDVIQVLKSINERGIDQAGIKAMIPTHYHFDHGGGSQALYEKMKPFNPNFKIWTTELTKKKLQNAKEHLTGAKTTFGKYVGTMDYIPDDAFRIVNTNQKIPLEIEGIEIELIHTPGHTPDHVAIAVYEHGTLTFIFTGEATGTLFNTEKILSLPTSMPPNFNYETYMDSFHKVVERDPPAIGFCHYGAIVGIEDCREFWKEHEEWMKYFREKVKKIFEEKQSARAVIEYMIPEFAKKSNTLSKNRNSLLENLTIALCYGVLVDLKFKEPKYEKPEE